LFDRVLTLDTAQVTFSIHCKIKTTESYHTNKNSPKRKCPLVLRDVFIFSYFQIYDE
jgi:hypothetical protein